MENRDRFPDRHIQDEKLSHKNYICTSHLRGEKKYGGKRKKKWAILGQTSVRSIWFLHSCLYFNCDAAALRVTYFLVLVCCS